eukprot:5470850-Pleurochrysis_carterae.AAC.1
MTLGSPAQNLIKQTRTDAAAGASDERLQIEVRLERHRLDKLERRRATEAHHVEIVAARYPRQKLRISTVENGVARAGVVR